MGNVLRSLYGQCCKPATAEDSDGSHGLSASAVGVLALAHDIFNFQNTSQVPDGLSKRVRSSRKAQAKWYRKLGAAWREAKPPPKTPEEASTLVVQALRGHQKEDVESLLAYYGLPLPHSLVQLTAPAPTSWPDGVQFELNTLPVDPKAVADGDTVTVYVSASEPRESLNVPAAVVKAAIGRSTARAARNYERADELHRIIVDAGYRVLNIENEEVLARKYRIRLRGIDAPECEMSYGDEAKQELTKILQRKCLRVLVYGEDQYGRSVADIYCNNSFVQELMLKRGMAWHYTAYDKRIELAKFPNPSCENPSTNSSFFEGFADGVRSSEKQEIVTRRCSSMDFAVRARMLLRENKNSEKIR